MEAADQHTVIATFFFEQFVFVFTTNLCGCIVCMPMPFVSLPQVRFIFGVMRDG